MANLMPNFNHKPRSLFQTFWWATFVIVPVLIVSDFWMKSIAGFYLK